MNDVEDIKKHLSNAIANKDWQHVEQVARMLGEVTLPARRTQTGALKQATALDALKATLPGVDPQTIEQMRANALAYRDSLMGATK